MVCGLALKILSGGAQVVRGWLLVFLYETWLGDLLLDWFERLTGLAVVPVEQVALWVDLEVGAAHQQDAAALDSRRAFA